MLRRDKDHVDNYRIANLKYRTVVHSLKTNHRMAIDLFTPFDLGEGDPRLRRIREGLWIKAIQPNRGGAFVCPDMEVSGSEAGYAK